MLAPNRIILLAFLYIMSVPFSSFSIMDPERATAIKNRNEAQTGNNDHLFQAIKNTEQESQDALKVEYKNFNSDKENFTKSQENQPNTLTILSKPAH